MWAARSPRSPSSAALIWPGVSRRVFAAASSMARGRPSRKRQRSATSSAWSRSRKSGATASARSTNISTAGAATISSADASSGGTSSGGTGISCSARRRSGSRLVDSTVRQEVRSTRSCTSRPPLAIDSRLSSTTRMRESRLASAVSSSLPVTARVSSRVSWASSVRSVVLRWTTPSNCVATVAAATAATLDFPEPPGPVSVSERTCPSDSRSRIRATSARRPNVGVEGRGSRAGSRGATAGTFAAGRAILSSSATAEDKAGPWYDGAARAGSCRRIATSSCCSAWPGSMPSSAASRSRALAYVASASACRSHR